MAFSTILRRSFSKAAPLATRLIGTQRAALSSAVRTAVPSPRFIGATGRHLCSTSTAVVDDGVSHDKKLVEAVQFEIHVVERSDDIGKIVDAPWDFAFSIEDYPGEQTVTLTREYGGETITVKVSMPCPFTEEEEIQDDSDYDDYGDDEKSPRPETTLPLLVTVTKQNGQYLEFDCTSFPDKIRINSLSLKNPEAEDQLTYEGPNFSGLHENLQEAFHEYLKRRGVKPSTGNYMHEYMIEKDYREYMQWLKDVKIFVEA